MTKTELLALAQRLSERRMHCWIHATGEMPKADGYIDDADCTAAAAALRECDALRADAERYRFLRDNRVDENDEGEKYITFYCDFEHYDDVDAAIDAARSAK